FDEARCRRLLLFQLLEGGKRVFRLLFWGAFSARLGPFEAHAFALRVRSEAGGKILVDDRAQVDLAVDDRLRPFERAVACGLVDAFGAVLYQVAGPELDFDRDLAPACPRL